MEKVKEERGRREEGWDKLLKVGGYLEIGLVEMRKEQEIYLEAWRRNIKEVALKIERGF